MKLRILLALLLAVTLTAQAADDPAQVYEKFHQAGLDADFETMRRHGTAERAAEIGRIAPAERQAMLRFLARMLPKTYRVAGTTISQDGNRATLRAIGSKLERGDIRLVKEQGEWKVDTATWGE